MLGMATAGAAVAQQRPTPTPQQQQQAADSLSARLGRPIAPEQIREAIRQSGLSEQDIRRRLQAAGYDPSLADSFFVAPGAELPSMDGRSAQRFAEALSSLGLLRPTAEDSLALIAARQAADSIRRLPPDSIFGRDVFRTTALTFSPSSTGAADPSYRLGLGDVVQLVLTGGVEAAYTLEVRGDGTIIIPQVGQVSVAGLTLDGARTSVRLRAGQVYSGVGSGRVGVDLSVARVRMSQVFVIGEVESPGAYQVSALSTVFHAIARAGGPRSRGSFRKLELRRAGRVVRQIDLYRYLLAGDASDDVRIEQGDIIYVPLSQRSVTIEGAVRRPAIYELIEGETLADLLRFAGGLLPTAVTDRVQIDRVLPAASRQAGIDRVLVDVALRGGVDAAAAQAALHDGDVVRAFSVGILRRNAVTLIGQVFQPGIFELRPGLTLGELVDASQGFLPWALSDRVKITRAIPRSGRREIFSLDFTTEEARTFPLAEFDSVFVLDGRLLYPSGGTLVMGAVNHPDSLPYVERQTLRDAIDRAGGFREDAAIVEVSRRRVGVAFTDTTSTLFTFTVDQVRRSNASGDFQLERDDRIFVRVAPGFREQRFVQLIGLFQFPGPYALRRDDERVSDVVKRAGGTLPGAYTKSFQILRDGKLVAIDFDRALRKDTRDDIELRDGDRLSIGPNPKTVYVTGEVNRSALVLYESGRSLDEYVALAGGARPTGNPDLAIVDYPSGMVRRGARYFKLFRTTPEIVAGSIITVPAKPLEKEGQFERALTTTVQVVTTLTSLVIAYIAVKK